MSLQKAFSLKDRNYIITGGGQGIGFAIAKAICEAGGNIAVLDIKTDPVDGFKSLQSEFNVKAHYFQADVTKEDSLNKAFKDAISALGSLHGVIPAAGIVVDKPFVKQTWDEVNRIQQVNVCRLP